MQIATLADRFAYYAMANVDLAHDPDSKTPAFFVCNIEEISAAIKNGISLPCMFLQVPEFEKSGLVDNAVENVECSFLVLKKNTPGDTRQRLHLFDECKAISDQIVNYMVRDADEYFEGGQVKTSEGVFGPIADNLYGWAVSFGFDQAYNAEVDETKWREI